MRYNLGIRIQTSGKRKRWLEVLGDILYRDGGKFNSMKIIEQTPLWQCARECLLSAKEGESHLLILQDDILPCRDFITTANYMAGLLPNEMITLFSSNEHIRTVLDKKVHWVKLPVWFMAQAYIVPVQLATEMVAWIDDNVKETVQLDDDRIATYLWFNKRKVWACAPSLVEHIGWNETTLRSYEGDLKKKAATRMAAKFIGFENSGMSFDWQRTIKDVIEVNEGNDSQFISNLKHKL